MSEASVSTRLFEDWDPAKRNAALGTVVAVFGSALYYVSAFDADPQLGRSLATPLDEAIPFVPASVYAYAAIYTAMFFPAFVVRSYEIFRRTLLAYMLVVFASLAIFLAFPVSAVELRADLSGLDMRVFHHWGMRLVYFLDPPTNLFPSLHLSIATVAFLSTRYASRRYAIVPALLALGIGLSIFTTKQHFIADGVAGFVLASAMVTLAFRGYDPEREPDPERVFGRRALVAFLGYHLAIYLAAFSLFLAGWQPW